MVVPWGYLVVCCGCLVVTTGFVQGYLLVQMCPVRLVSIMTGLQARLKELKLFHTPSHVVQGLNSKSCTSNQAEVLGN